MHRHQRRYASWHPRMEGRTERVDIELLGHFEVVVDGTPTPARAWTRRSAAALVKILAMAPGHRLHREEVMEILWPDEAPAEAAPKLHKAAHYARKASGRHDAVRLRSDMVELFPGATLTVDVELFEELARRATADGDALAVRAAIDLYGGELLPADRYEQWASERRELLRLRHLDLLRLAGRWREVSEQDPTDESAHLELMRHFARDGDGGAALRQYEHMETVLERDLGAEPGHVARELRDLIAAERRPAARRTARAGRPDAQDPLSTALGGPEQITGLIAELVHLNRRQTVVLESLVAFGASAVLQGSGAPL